MKQKTTGSDSYKRIYKIVLKIPIGTVATYGQIANLAQMPGHARQVGYALHSTPASMELPWWRVINSKGEISFPIGTPYFEIQRKILLSEGIIFDRNMRIDLKLYKWKK